MQQSKRDSELMAAVITENVKQQKSRATTLKHAPQSRRLDHSSISKELPTIDQNNEDDETLKQL